MLPRLSAGAVPARAPAPAFRRRTSASHTRRRRCAASAAAPDDDALPQQPHVPRRLYGESPGFDVGSEKARARRAAAAMTVSAASGF
jgi:hypothetical protein